MHSEHHNGVTAEENPLLELETLPRFAAIRAEHIQPAVERILQLNRQWIAELMADPCNATEPDWDTLMRPLEEAEDRLDKVWSTASHLNAVLNTPAIRSAYDACQPLVIAYHSELGQNRALYLQIKRLSERAEELRLDQSQRKIIRDALLDFHLAGVALDEDSQKQFADLEKRLSQLGNEFGNNVLDATRAWSKLVTDEQVLLGLPQTTLDAAADNARRKGGEGFLLTLDFPCYYAVMNHADNAHLREEVYRAYTTRASSHDDFGGRWDNSARIDEILHCRAQLAALLGYRCYAELSLARKMAASTDTVTGFLQDMIRHSRPAAEREFAELQAFARENYGRRALQAWDVAYYSEKLREQRFALSQEELRPYFPASRVCQGLFDIVGRLYGIRIIRNTCTETWHEQVEFYDIVRDGVHVASFFLDLYTREGKRGGAWMSGCRNHRSLAGGHTQIPVAYLVCNFAPATSTTPALLTHTDVTTLFHEFGHGLHHMLTREPYLRSAGINGVAWDAVELPSQLMENWCWNAEALGMVSGHYLSSEPLPESLLQKMLAARNFQAGMKSMRQLEYALFDFQLHLRGPAAPAESVDGILARVREQTAIFPQPDYHSFQNSFSHIFAGGYAAGYYSYKWAEVLSADVFSRFAASGVFNAETGAEFLDRLLARGGSDDALHLFVDFMGREPDLEALLRQEGLR